MHADLEPTLRILVVDDGVDLKLGRETLSLAFPSSGMRQAFRWRPAFTKALTASATI